MAFQAFLGFLGNPRIKLNDHHAIKSLQWLQVFLNEKNLEGMEYFLLAFPGNPRIKEEPRVLEIILVRSSIQADPGFFAHKEKPEKCGKFSPCFHGFSRNSWKARRARTLLAFLGLFLAFPSFSTCAKMHGIEARNFTREILGSFLQGKLPIVLVVPL